MLSILIVNWNTRDLLRSCLLSIFKHPPDCPFEVIVVDNNSSDGSADMVSLEFVSIKLIKPGSNLGYAAGNNLAYRSSNGDYVLTLNPDTEFDDDTLNKSIEILRDKTDCGVLGLRLVGPDNKTQFSVRGFPTLLGVFGNLTKLDRLFPMGRLGSYSLPRFDYQRDQYAPQPMGTFLLFRRTALETLEVPEKPFDEKFPIFFNEVDLLLRLKLNGWNCWYAATCHILHQHGASTRQVKKSMIWESHRSLVRYFNKHLKGAERISLPFIAALATLSAFVKAKGYDAGFRPDHNHM